MTIWYCNARKRRCNKCGHKFTKEEHELWACPECGTDRHCKQKVHHEGKRCKLHGGAALVGAAAPGFKDGRYSKLLPTGLADRYEEALKDTQLLALRDEIALLDARIGSLLDSLESGGAVFLWEKLQERYDSLVDSVAKRRPEKVSEAIQEIGSIITEGIEDSEAWNELYNLFEQRRRLVESENKRILQTQQIITAEQAMVLLARIQKAIISNVQDKHALAAIAAEFRELVSLPTSE